MGIFQHDEYKINPNLVALNFYYCGKVKKLANKIRIFSDIIDNFSKIKDHFLIKEKIRFSKGKGSFSN